MAEYLKRDDVFSKADILTVYTKEYGSIEMVPVEYLADLPTTDAEEVVRCKVCKYWAEEKDFGMFCSHWGSTLTESQADDYCSYGERKQQKEV